MSIDSTSHCASATCRVDIIVVTGLEILVPRHLLANAGEFLTQVECVPHYVCFEHPAHLQSALRLDNSVDLEEPKLGVVLTLEYYFLFLRGFCDIKC